ncbi:hypothetical protein H0H92_010640 [Tricholoma furcatifolium]|nr:hypothetical protein H0H92_010640 [Tricholoma furcatifolium]
MPKALVANRGEIAIRVLRSAAELGWSTVAIYTEGDESHATYADEAVKLDAVDSYLNVGKIVDLAQRFKCTHLHPGYGFLSESPALASALPPSIVFIGPSIDTLRISSDKLLSRDLATSLGVRVASGRRVSSIEDVHTFLRAEGLPVMIKALDGGGGRGIRIVRGIEEVEEAFNRCLGESPSRQIFVEKALTGPSWKHVEVQIIGDGTSAIHLWERECSVQRRFQKIIEVAPSRLPSAIVKTLLESSMKMAKQVKYRGLGTFEYLVNAQTAEWEITGIDLVRAQLLLFSTSPTLASLELLSPPSPTGHAIQLRLTAEDPLRSFRLSSGTLKPGDIVWPSGRGVRIDTWISDGPFASDALSSWTISPEFDSLLAKVIIRGPSFEETSQKALRALRELRVSGLPSTNRSLLAGVISHPDWLLDQIDTLWLERNLDSVLEYGKSHLTFKQSTIIAQRSVKATSSSSAAAALTQTTLLQPETLFHLTLSPSNSNDASPPLKHSLTLSSIAENDFPVRLSGTLQTSLSPSPLKFSLTQSTSASVATSAFELANPNDESHIASPLTGKIVELHPALMATQRGEGKDSRFVRKGDTLIILSVMKMESTVGASNDCYVERVGKGIRNGAILGEGMLVCVTDSSSNTLVSKL